MFLACDLPFPDVGFVEALLQRAMMSSPTLLFLEPLADGSGLCATYNRSCLSRMQEAIEHDHAGIISLFQFLRVESLHHESMGDPESWEQIFLSVNTPQEWQEAE